MPELGAAAGAPPPEPWRLHDPDGAPVDPALGGPLLVGAGAGVGPGAGVVVVATDALLAHAERLDALADALASDAAALAHLPPVPAELLVASPAGLRAATRVAETRDAVRLAAADADRARTALRHAVERYASAEAERRAAVVRLGEQLGAALGPWLRVVAVAALPALLLSRVTGLPGPDQVRGVRDWLLDNPRLITSPAFVEAVRTATSAVDDAADSFAGLPAGTVESLAGAHGFTGVEVGAALAVGAAMPFGLFREGPVRVERVLTMPGIAPPQGAVDRLARVPEGDQVRVERYEAPGVPPRFVVYVGPTETFAPRARDEPWDLTSNVAGVAGGSAGSIRAAEAAMHDAGVQPGDEVQLVGFSQGGLVAARLAASGDWNVRGLETYGAPTGGVELPAGLFGLAVRHTDDLVPALGGEQVGGGVLPIERRAFSEGSAIPDELPAPAHQRSAYAATATEIDRAASAAVREQVAAMDDFAAEYARRDDARITVMLFHAERGAARGSGATASGGSDR